MLDQRQDEFILQQIERQQRENARQLSEIKDRLNLIDRRATHFGRKTIELIAAGYGVAISAFIIRAMGDGWVTGVVIVLFFGVFGVFLDRFLTPPE
jgi:hypothetical protein